MCSIILVVSSFAICYRNKLWRNEINVRKRMARMTRRNTKEDIIFNLSKSSGMSGELFIIICQKRKDLSGVRANNEIVRNMGSSLSVYEELAVQENKVMMDMKNVLKSTSSYLSVPGRESRENYTGLDEKASMNDKKF